MLAPFFSVAMAAPGRQAAFRRAAVGHLAFAAIGVGLVGWKASPEMLRGVGYALLGAGIVEGAVLIGWRLAQLPKSQALEFLLTSPVHPWRLFLAEAAVGLARFLLVQLSGLPLLLLLVVDGRWSADDLLLGVGFPLVFGALTGLGLTVWAYETRLVKRVGEAVSGLGILVYLTVGVLAGERLKYWLDGLPDGLAAPALGGARALHAYNPFGVLQYWFDPRNNPAVAGDRAVFVAGLGLLLAALCFLRAMARLKGHFHDRHYRPISSDRAAQTEWIGDRPLSWWAVRRVMEYSGRVNIWLAGGVGVLYAVYMLAGDRWPPWLGRGVFELFERLGGAPALVTGLVVLSAVPAAFQYGLWDPTADDRRRRLELLLLTDLTGPDYWHAAMAAAWRRGRGYFAVAGLLWLALLWSGRATPAQVAASTAAGVLLWGFSFALGFGAFSRGRPSNGLATLLTLGLPLLTAGLSHSGAPVLAALLPPGAVYVALTGPPGVTWLIGPALTGLATVWLSRRSTGECESRLRDWCASTTA
jgi:hypothetical protein